MSFLQCWCFSFFQIFLSAKRRTELKLWQSTDLEPPNISSLACLGPGWAIILNKLQKCSQKFFRKNFRLNISLDRKSSENVFHWKCVWPKFHFQKKNRPIFRHIFRGSPEPSKCYLFHHALWVVRKPFFAILWVFLKFPSAEPGALISQAWPSRAMAGDDWQGPAIGLLVD